MSWLLRFFSFDNENIASRHIDSRQRARKTWNVGEKEPQVKVGDIIEKYGQVFTWSDLHVMPSRLQCLRSEGDVMCDMLLETFNPQPKDDVLDKILDDAKESSDLNAKNFIHAYSEVPAWVDWEQVRRGQKVFIRDLPACGISLYYLSLVGGFSAPLITKVLRATGYLTSGRKQVIRRLADTSQMIFECLMPDSLLPNNKGWLSVLRVRFLHGMVRRRLKSRPYWNEKEWGVPINQEDMSATLLAFSYNVLIGIELVLGKPLNREDQECYIHLWRYIGWLIGVDDKHNPCTSVDRAKATLESIVMHILEPDEDSRAVAFHLLQVPRNGRGLAFRQHLCRKFIGDKLADSLGLPVSTLWQSFTYFFMICIRLYRLPSFKDSRDKRYKGVFLNDPWYNCA
ncbi:hypothetical protein GUITHDRAFT_146491 [Guillardia theta CCMP2712]|uniref:ER-bound oxygenase mpaB/mpaB'/Rubber oxygenase catalytic domain-containing protein n=1 Tax=Guillardia theta (strain CCMP2712) TaxID=905079 RepID=L1IGW4_GUITC|nr:hypothetical protein GUITHDRAFT_146491 [Guillardia theta CCMP2712]EKX35478.1 hypothetical protein GUITHDRAFT_146491 [Guillardia theta CCMP2712]|eukprot:XP_005822458.1 hypothetical protein GUITHDRAFT_146491 [Guillardia theta CCMP2712]